VLLLENAHVGGGAVQEAAGAADEFGAKLVPIRSRRDYEQLIQGEDLWITNQQISSTNHYKCQLVWGLHCIDTIVKGCPLAGKAMCRHSDDFVSQGCTSVACCCSWPLAGAA